ncbi:MAG: type II toxin-antitoxin system VapC family toxin [Deltaproteobacteria bacterium]|nr:type II toxin-antitoxin system VapC family toxin [Deltaproteobacteria bacterium]
MRLLLDTHVALWAITADRRLTRPARARLTADDAEVFVSAASLWEIGIKHALGRGDMPVDAELAAEEFRRAGFRPLAITWTHMGRAAALPPLHRDPFDRLLVAQALAEPLVLMTHDARVAAYDAGILEV